MAVRRQGRATTSGAASTFNTFAQRHAQSQGVAPDVIVAQLQSLLAVLMRDPQWTGMEKRAVGEYNAVAPTAVGTLEELLTRVGGRNPAALTQQYGPNVAAAVQTAPDTLRYMTESVAAGMDRAVKQGGFSFGGGSLTGSQFAQADSYVKQAQAAAPPPWQQPESSFFDRMGQSLTSALSSHQLPLMAGHAVGALASGDMSALSGTAMRGLMMLASEAPALAIPLALAGGAAAVGVEANKITSTYATEEQGLAARISKGNVDNYESSHHIADNLRYVGQSFNIGPDESERLGMGLAAAGVTGPADLGGGTATSMALARLTGLSTDQTGSLVASRIAPGRSGGGQSWDEATLAFEDMQHAASDAGVPLNKVVQSLQSLNDAAGKAAYNTVGLATAQAFVGSGVDAGKLLAPSMGAVGVNAMQQAALLGVSNAQFMKMQTDPGAMLAGVQGFVKRMAGGPGDKATNTLEAEQLVQSYGLLDTSGLSAKQQSGLIQGMLTGRDANGKPFDIAAKEKEFQKDAANQRLDGAGSSQQQANAYLEQIAHSTLELTPALDRLSVVLQNMVRNALTVTAGDRTGAGTAPGAGNLAPGDFALKASSPAMEKRWEYLASSQQTGWSYASDPQHVEHTGAIPKNYQIEQIYTKDKSLTGYQVVPIKKKNGSAGDGGTLNAPIDDGYGNAHGASPEVLRDYEAASARTGVPLAVLLAQGSRESGLDPTKLQVGGNGRGLAQFDFTPGANANNAAHWLGQAEKTIGRGVGMNPRQAALDPQIASMAQALYMQSLTKDTHGDLRKSLSDYNGGANGWNITGKPGQGRDYGEHVYSAAQALNLEINGKLTVVDGSGKTIGYVTLDNNGRATTTPRQPVGAHPGNAGKR